MRLGLFGFGFDNSEQLWFRDFIQLLKERGHFICLYEELLNNVDSDLFINESFPILSSVDDIIKHELDLVISLGGDGTMLRAVSFSYLANVPLLGINLGRLGFLASVEKKNTLTALSNLEKGEFVLQNRSLLQLYSENNLFEPSPVALNEFTISKRDTSSMITIHTYIDGDFFNTYWADGLIISTPTGSTAYSLSCGGPIVTPGSGNLIITPIAPHNLNVRPVVISDSSTIELKFEGRTNNFLCSLDSRFNSISSGNSLIIKRSKQYARIAVMKDYSFSEALRQKLGWGVDKRTNLL